MRLTLKSLQTEMRHGFGEVHDRIDRISLRLDNHIEETAFYFREIDKRFDQVDNRFEQIDNRFDQIDRRFDQIDRRFD